MALVNPNIAMSFRMPEFTPRNALAEYAQIQQIQGGQRQAEVADLQLQRIRQTDEALEKVRQIAMQNGGPSDLNEIAKAYLGAPNQEMQQFGLGLLQKMRERTDFDRTYKSLYPEAAAATPTNAMASTSMPTGAPALELPSGAQPPGDYTSTQAMGRVPGVVTTPIPESPPMNAMAPAAAPTAPVNALAAPAAPAGKTVADLRREIMLFSQSADPRAKAMVDVLKSQITEASKPYVVGGRLVTGAGTELYAAPDKPTELQRNYEFAKTPAGGNFKGSLADFKVLSTPKTTVQLPPQEKAFESGLGAGQSKRILDNQVAAQDAAEILRTNQVGRDLLEAGAITGTGADFLVGLNNALKQVGVDFGYADAAANSQAYVATLGANVGRIIKQFGAGTGLSDADRDFAEKIAGGKIALTETALRRILDINDKASNRVIDLHNKNVAGIKTNIPLTVEKPVFQRPPASAASQIPGNAPAPARAAPAAAPIYARNPQTNQRIMSTDGGNTWTPAR